jgi:hypothetical protein
MAGMGTHLATERVRLVTPRLQLARPEFYPNPFEVVLDTILARVTLVPGNGALSTWRS